MTDFVVDASVAAKWYFKEEGAASAVALMAPSNQLLAPDLLWTELGSVICKRLQRGEIVVEEALGMISSFGGIPLEIVSSKELLSEAVGIATITRRSLYDCLYLALAVARNCPLITADRRLVNALSNTGWAKRIRMLDQIA